MLSRVVRRILFASALFASLFSFAQADTKDEDLPGFPTEAAACEALNAEGAFVFATHPFRIRGIDQEEGLRISGFLLPATPIFAFIAESQRTFFSNWLEFDPHLKCQRDGVFGDDHILRFTHLSPGKYIIFIDTAITVRYTAERYSSVLAAEGYYETVAIPYEAHYDRRRRYCGLVTVSSNGTVLATDPHFAAGLGD
jgi:hypothetical protein